ncbi:MAG TPA: phage tail protein [Candidatus Omnitrophota bacterium]|nr:phage tail protein [Candidatus Omnitrophota bacterium]
MITIKFIPNVQSKEGRITQYAPYVPSKALADYLEESGFELEGMRFIVTGERIEDTTKVLQEGDEIIVTPDVQIVAAVIALAKAAIAFVAAHPFIAAGMFLATVYSVYSAVTAGVRTPSFGNIDTNGGIDESSPTYGWDGITTQQAVGVPIPIVYGRHRVGGNIINQYIRTDGDKQYLNVLLALCEGEVESITDLKINKNPEANYSGITTTKRYGTNTQTVIANFNDSHSVIAKNDQLLQSAVHTYTTVSSAVEAFELTFSLPSGLYQINASSGAVQAWEVTYNVQYKLHAAGSYTDLGDTTISGTSRNALKRIFRKDGLTAGQYDIKITRTSVDSSLSPQMTGDLYLASIDEITQNEPLIYPNVALIGIEALATDQLSGSTPNFTMLVEGRKILIPQIMNGAVEVDWEDYYWDPVASAWKLLADDTVLSWDGTTYVARFCANPIWCMKDLLTNTRYGLGDYITSAIMDSAKLLEMAKYCEEKVSNGDGGYEKRFRLDVVIDSSSKALDVITQLSATFRAFPFYSGGDIQLKIDKEDIAVQMFGMGNIIESSFTQSWKSINEMPNCIEVQFMDQDKDYEQETIAIMDESSLNAGNPLRKKQLRLFCTRVSQCIREGKYALNLAKYIHRSVTLRAGIDAIACQAGDIINVAHDVPAWGIGSGRVAADASNSTTHIHLDQAITLVSGKTYKIMIRFADDTMEERTITTAAGTVSAVDVSVAFSQIPQAYDVYSIGETTVKPFRVTSIKRYGENEVEIGAVEYLESVYDTEDIQLPDNNYSALDITVPSVTDLTTTERLVKLGDGTIENVIDVWFNRPLVGASLVNYSRARIYLSDDAGNSYRNVGETNGTHFAIMGGLNDGSSYKIRVASISYLGVEQPDSLSQTSTITLAGKSAPPSAVTTFLVNQSRDRLYFGWSDVADVDLSGYEIRFGESWESGIALISNYKGNSYISLNFKEGSSQKYWIKAIDSSGNYSATATEGDITVDNIPFTNIIQSYSEQTGWAGTKTNTSKVGNNLEVSAGELSGTYVTPVRDIGYVASFKIGIDTVVVDASSAGRMNDDATRRFNDSLTARWSGEEVAGAVSFRIKTSDDNATWSAWRDWQAGDYKCRYFQIEMTMTRSDTSKTIQCSALDYYADLPDVDEKGTGTVSNASTGLAVTLAKTFHEAPSVNIDILSGDGYVHKFSVVPSTTGFTVKLYKLDGTAVTGDFSYHAHGV